MRITGLPEFQGSVSRPGAAVSLARKVLPSQRVAAEANGAENPVSASLVSAGTEAPVDHARVAEIRKAIEDNTYPLVPAEIADAIIAAGLFTKVAK